MEPYENPFACAFCEQSFSKASFLVNHVQIVHNSNKPLDSKNEKEDTDAEAQETPKLSKESINKLYQCKYCGKKFKTITKTKLNLITRENFND